MVWSSLPRAACPHRPERVNMHDSEDASERRKHSMLRTMVAIGAGLVFCLGLITPLLTG